VKRAIAVSVCGIYDSVVSDHHDGVGASTGEEWERVRQRIVDLEGELERYREREELVTKTLLSAVSHATAIRDDARREAELTLRKAKGKAAQRRADALREQDEARRELMRLLRITDQMRRGLSDFLAEKVDELRPEAENNAASSQAQAELDAALEDAMKQKATVAAPSRVPVSHPQADVPERSGDGSIGGSLDGLQ
jgi:DivIVA protein